MWTVPNIITSARLVMVPVFLWFVTRGTTAGAVLGLAVFAVAGISDTLDGWIARRCGSDSDLGRFLDPLADKLLVLSAFYWAALGIGAARVWFSIWLVHLIALREITITVLRTVRRRRGEQVITAAAGKAKTTWQIITVATVLTFEAAARVTAAIGWSGTWLDSGAAWWLVQALFAVALVLTVISGVRYFTVNAATMPLTDRSGRGERTAGEDRSNGTGERAGGRAGRGGAAS